MTNPEISPDVTVLLPKIIDFDRMTNRYAGLFDELGEWGLSAMLVHDMNHTYSEQKKGFEGGFPYDGITRAFTYDDTLVVRPRLVRDLTMAVGDRALYRNPDVTLVHQPAFNAILANRSSVHALLPNRHPETFEVTNEADLSNALDSLSGNTVVVKPVEVSEKEDKKIFSADKALVAERIAELGISLPLLVQGVIESQQGIPELRIAGSHILRVIMIGSKSVFASSKSTANPDKPPVYYWPSELPGDVGDALREVRDTLATLPDGRNTVVAADFVRGHQNGGEEEIILDGLRRKPLRVSPSSDHSLLGGQWAARRWDRHEAELLHGKFSA